MKILSVDIAHYRIPLPVTLSDSTHGQMTAFGLITARIRDEEGVDGLGYTYTVGDCGGDAVQSVLVRDLAPILEGMDASRIEQIWEQMWWRTHFLGRGGLVAFAMAAVDVALWDLKAKRAGEPMWRFLGGHSDRVPAYAGGIDLDFTLEALLDQAGGFLDQGFRAIKMKVGRDRLSQDVARVRAMRELLGDEFPLMVDANMRWSVSEAVGAARALQPFGLIWFEEPTIPDDFRGHAQIQKEGGVPIAAGENLRTIYEFEHLIAAGGAAFPEPDLATMGGITPWLKVAHLAEAANLPVTSHGVHDLHVHLLSAVPNSSYLEVHGFGLERFMAHPLNLVEGEAVAPDRPGHGVELDWDALQAHRA